MIVVNGVARVARNLGNSVLLRTHPYTGPPVQSPHLPFAIKFLCICVHAYMRFSMPAHAHVVFLWRCERLFDFISVIQVTCVSFGRCAAVFSTGWAAWCSISPISWPMVLSSDDPPCRPLDLFLTHTPSVAAVSTVVICYTPVDCLPAPLSRSSHMLSRSGRTLSRSGHTLPYSGHTLSRRCMQCHANQSRPPMCLLAALPRFAAGPCFFLFAPPEHCSPFCTPPMPLVLLPASLLFVQLHCHLHPLDIVNSSSVPSL